MVTANYFFTFRVQSQNYEMVLWTTSFINTQKNALFFPSQRVLHCLSLRWLLSCVPLALLWKYNIFGSVFLWDIGIPFARLLLSPLSHRLPFSNDPTQTHTIIQSETDISEPVCLPPSCNFHSGIIPPGARIQFLRQPWHTQCMSNIKRSCLFHKAM